jgi:hypothetical protein
MWIGFIWLRISSLASSCEHGNDFSGSIKGEKFLLQQLTDVNLVLIKY